MLAGTFFSAISQVLLKQSANMEYKNPLREYLNWRVILAYGIFFGVLLLNTWCYTKVDMKFGPVIDTASSDIPGGDFCIPYWHSASEVPGKLPKKRFLPA